MDILFLITGFLFAASLPLTGIFSSTGIKGILFYFIMVLFFMFVIAYAVLSVSKFFVSKVDYLERQKITGWNTDGYKKKKSVLPYVISCVIGIVCGAGIIINGVSLIVSVLLSLAIAFSLLGWWLMGIKRYEAKINELPDFLLSHMGLIVNGKAELFDGYSTGILKAEKINNILALTILRKKKQSVLEFEIPKEKEEEVNAFLEDLHEQETKA